MANMQPEKGGQTPRKTNKDKQIEKRNQEMARRKAEAEARQQAIKAKKKKRIIIIAVAVVLVVAIVCAVAIPVGIQRSRTYKEVNFRTLTVPTTAEQAAGLPQYNRMKVEMEGYTFPCTSKYYVLCKTAVNSCPYVAGSVPNNGIRMEMADGSYFNQGNNAHVRIHGTLRVNTVNVEKFEGFETYMYLVVDKIEEI